MAYLMADVKKSTRNLILHSSFDNIESYREKGIAHEDSTGKEALTGFKSASKLLQETQKKEEKKEKPYPKGFKIKRDFEKQSDIKTFFSKAKKIEANPISAKIKSLQLNESDDEEMNRYGAQIFGIGRFLTIDC